MLLTKTTAAQNEVALSYHKVRGLCFLAVVFVATIVLTEIIAKCQWKVLKTRTNYKRTKNTFIIKRVFSTCFSISITTSECHINLYKVCTVYIILYTV